jgi:hypothetical protein
LPLSLVRVNADGLTLKALPIKLPKHYQTGPVRLEGSNIPATIAGFPSTCPSSDEPPKMGHLQDCLAGGGIREHTDFSHKARHERNQTWRVQCA